MRYRFLLILFIISLGSYAQDGHRWETVLGQVMTAEDMADEGWQQNYEMLCELEQNPINRRTGGAAFSVGTAGGGYNGVSVSLWLDEIDGRTDDDTTDRTAGATTATVLCICW